MHGVFYESRNGYFFNFFATSEISAIADLAGSRFHYAVIRDAARQFLAAQQPLMGQLPVSGSQSFKLKDPVVCTQPVIWNSTLSTVATALAPPVR